MGDYKENYREEEDSLNGDEQPDENQEQTKKPAKKKYMLRKRIEEDIKNSKAYISGNGKLMQPQPQGMKRSFASVARRASQMKKTLMIPLSSNQTSMIGDNKQRDTIYSQKSIGTEQYLQKQDDKKLQQPIEENYKPEINGPQVELSKKDMSFIINTGLVAFDSLTVRNNGSASIYYEWKRVETSKLYGTTILDPEQKFFCHHEQNVIIPGQSKNFVFAFMSKVTGIFMEEWELQCEPPPTHPIPRLKLTGNSIQVDMLQQWRQEFDKDSLDHFVSKNMGEIINDIIGQVRTPTPPLPDLENEDVCRREFEEKNQDLHLWYNPLVMKWWRQLQADLYDHLHMIPEQQYWDLNLSYIKSLIEMVDDEDDKFFYESRYNEYVELCKQKPVERSEIYSQVKDFIWKLALNVPVNSDKTKEELSMWEYVFRPPLDEREWTEAELKQFEDEKSKIKAEWMKKTKKKKWTDEEEKKLIEDYRASLSSKIGNEVYQFFEGFEEKDAYNRALSTIKTRQSIPALEYFEQLLRKKPVKDLDIDGKRIMLRVHLRLSKAPGTLDKKLAHEQRLIQERDEEIKRIEEEKLLAEKLAKEKKKNVKRPPPPKKGAKAPVEEEKPKEKILDVSFLDEDCLSTIVDSLKYLFERQAKLVILLVSYDTPIGEFKFTSSVKFFVEYLKKQIENQITFNESIYIDNFEEKIETESFPENSVVVLENAYFVPEEVGFKQEKIIDANANNLNSIVNATLNTPSNTATPKNVIHPPPNAKPSVAENKNATAAEKNAAAAAAAAAQAAEAQNALAASIETKLVKYKLEDKQEYIHTLSSYCPSFVLEDKDNFFSRFTSLVSMKFENQVLGTRISEDIQHAVHLLAFDKPHFHVFIGGELTPEKLIAIDTLSAHSEAIYLYGKIGIKFLIVQQEIALEEKVQQQIALNAQAAAAAPVPNTSSGKDAKADKDAKGADKDKGDKTAPVVDAASLLSNSLFLQTNLPNYINANFAQFPLLPIEKLAIRGLISGIKTRGKANLILPQDFIIVPDTQIETIEYLSPPWLDEQLKQRQNYPPRIVPPSQIPINLGTDQNQTLSQAQSPKNNQPNSQADTRRQSAVAPATSRKSGMLTPQTPQAATQTLKPTINNNTLPSVAVAQPTQPAVQLIQTSQSNLPQQPAGTTEDLHQDNTEIMENQEEEEDIEFDEDGQPLIIKKAPKNQNQNYNLEIQDIEDETEVFTYDNQAIFPAGYMIVDFGEQSLNTLKKGIRKARKLGWFEELSIINSVSTNETNKLAAKTLHKMQEEKRIRLDQSKGNNDYNYINDVLAFLCGKTLEKQLNLFELVEAPPKQPEEEEQEGSPQNDALSSNSAGIQKKPTGVADNNEEQKQDNEDDENNKSVHSATTAITKPNSVKVISDFFSRDSEFILKILHGTYIEALSSIESYSQKSTSNLSDDFSFLDRL